MVENFNNTKVAFDSKTENELRKALFLFKLAGNKTLVKIGTTILDMASSFNLPIKGIIKSTIFNHFCGGENIKECKIVIEKLGKRNVKTILQYATEGKETQTQFDDAAKKSIETIEAVTNIDDVKFSVVKISGIASHDILEKVTHQQTLNETEQAQYQRAVNRLNTICEAAIKANIALLVDAEETWIQACIDDMVMDAMRKYNKEKTIVYNTYQLYRTDRLAYLKSSFETAKTEGFFLGCKPVRGAYMEMERERANKFGYISPIQKNKEATDNDYNAALAFCIENIDKIGLCAGTHNEESSIYLSELFDLHKLN